MVTNTVTSLIEPLRWRRPRHVRVEVGFLLVDFEGCSTYPLLLQCAAEPQALSSLIAARTDEEACQFTERWGLLYEWLQEGRTDRFPLDLFHLHRQHFLALARLSTALRSENRRDVKPAFGDLAETYLQLVQRRYAQQASRLRHSQSQNRNVGGTDAGAPLQDVGAPLSHVLMATLAPASNTAQRAAQELALQLEIPTRLQAVKRDKQWTFEDTPVVETLSSALLWLFRSRYRILRHYSCEGCGQASVAWRRDRRYCKSTCGTRVRVQRHRHKKKRRRRL